MTVLEQRAIRAAIAALAAFWGVSAAAQQTPVFRGGTDAVLVDVSVRSNNRAVTGLTSADFELLDSGVPQAIDSISIEAIPIDVTLLLDTSVSTDGRLLDRLKQGVRDTARLLRADDRIRVVAVQHVVNEIVPLQPAQGPLPVDRLAAQGGTALYDGLVAAMMRPSVSGRRQLLVAYTDGDDASSITTAAAALDVALRADAVLHVVVPVENAGSAAPERRGGELLRTPGGRVVEIVDRRAAGEAFPNESTLRDVADRTGGRVFVIGFDDSIGEAFREVLDDYRRSYLLRYSPQGVPREGWHDIVVRVRKPGTYDVRARKGWGQ